MITYYEGYVVPCSPKKEWGEWMSNTTEQCPTGSKMDCVGVCCDDCIYSVVNADVRKEFYEYYYGKRKEELPELSEKVFHCPDCPKDALYLMSDAFGDVWAFDIPLSFDRTRLRTCRMVKLEIRCKPLSIVMRPPRNKASCESCKNYSSKEEPKKEHPKLTQAVFDSEDCPDWANWAAVDKDGRAAWYSERPEIDRGSWFLKKRNDRFEWIKTPSHLAFRYYDSSEWMLSLIERPRLPKLTQAVFDRGDCPSWARYAASDANGKAAFYEDHPFIDLGTCWKTYTRVKYIPGYFEKKLAEISRYPKLTVEVFSRDDCPKWANWAAVDKDGRAFWYKVKPNRGVSGYATEAYIGELIAKPERFDSSDWEYSLIERPQEAFL